MVEKEVKSELQKAASRITILEMRVVTVTAGVRTLRKQVNHRDKR